jgi:hypothetical protein
MPLDSFDSFHVILASLQKLKKALPHSIPSAPKDSRIVEVFTRVPVPNNPLEHWEACNRRLDSLFGEDLRDAVTGRLPNIQKGKHGLDLVLRYLEDCVEANSIPWDAALPKVERLRNELQFIM